MLLTGGNASTGINDAILLDASGVWTPGNVDAGSAGAVAGLGQARVRRSARGRPIIDPICSGDVGARGNHARLWWGLG